MRVVLRRNCDLEYQSSLHLANYKYTVNHSIHSLSSGMRSSALFNFWHAACRSFDPYHLTSFQTISKHGSGSNEPKPAHNSQYERDHIWGRGGVKREFS